MKELRRRFNIFCFRNKDKGIPNLMLYIILGSGLVYLMTNLGYDQLYTLLCFDRAAILRGQVWRLFTFAFAMQSSNVFLTLILLYCYYSLGRAVESAWGTFRFNLFYLSGILMMDIFALAFGGIPVHGYDFSFYYGANMSSYLNLSLLISFATLYPDTRFMIFFVIPIKAWVLGLIYLIITFYEVLTMTLPLPLFPHNLFPLIAMGNYFLFFGKDVLNLLPMSWRIRRKKASPQTASGHKTIPFTRQGEKESPVKENYNHRCTVCGRTDVSNPELEFRYCSRCNGYHCYCEEHISNHTHIE